MNFAALHPRLKVDWISGTAPPTTVIFPPAAEPNQERIGKRILTYARHIERPSKLMQRGTRTVRRNCRKSHFPTAAQLCLFGTRATCGSDHETSVLLFTDRVNPSGPGNQVRMQRPEVSHLKIQL